jgi:hypothetical protein
MFAVPVNLVLRQGSSTSGLVSLLKDKIASGDLHSSLAAASREGK